MAGGNYGPGGGNGAAGHNDEKKTSAVPDSKFAPQPQLQPQVGAGAAAAGARQPLAQIGGAADRKVAVASAAPGGGAGVRSSAAGASGAGGVAPMEGVARGDNGMQVFGARGGAAAAGAGAGAGAAGDGKHKGDGASVMDDYKRVVEAREKKLMEERAREDERKRADEKALASVRRTLRPFYQYQWLDVKDTENNWLEANIIAIEDKDGEPCIHIHYKGWKDKYDEWLPLRQCNDETSTLSQRLAPYLSKFRPETQRHGNVLPREGLQVDLLDTTDKWLSGEIVEVRQFPDGPMLKVRYTGWDPKYDEWITAESYRIAPLRTFTRALPPPVRNNSRYTAEQIEAMRATLDNETKFRLLLEAKMQCTIVVQAGDGNCCFRSVSHQVYGTADYHFLVRQRCMEYMRSEQSFYSQYVDGDFHMYIERMKLDGEWGDQIELQAMSEIYQRPVRVFAYSTDPYWEYKGLYQNNQPILVSYHFQSHYNSIQPLNPEVFAKPQLTTPPGEWEDLQLQRSRARGGRLARPGDNKEPGSGASPAAREAEQLQRALELSRNEFNNRDASQWEAGAAGRLQNFSSHADKMLDDAKKLSEQEFTQKQLMDAAMQRSEEELLAKVKAASLASQPVDQDPAVRAALEASMADAKAAGRAPQDDLARAIAASLAAQPGGAAAAAAGAADDLARVMELSRRDHERQQAAADDDLKAALAASAADPNARRAVAASAAANADTVVAACLEMGFSVDEAKAAYEVMYSPDVTKEILQQNVIGYLLSRRA